MKAFKPYWFCLPRAYSPLSQWLMSITFRESMYIQEVNNLLYWCMTILYAKCKYHQYLAFVNSFSCGRGEENKRSNNIRSHLAIPTPTQLKAFFCLFIETTEHSWTEIYKIILYNMQYTHTRNYACVQFYGLKGNGTPWCVPAVVIKMSGPRNLSVTFVPKGPVWRKHVEQLRQADFSRRWWASGNHTTIFCRC